MKCVLILLLVLCLNVTAISRQMAGVNVNTRDFKTTKQLINKLLSLIRNRYEMTGPHGGQFLLTTNNINSVSWDILKYKFATKLLSTNESYLMTFGGSSVTAGHDSYYNQSYPSIFNKRVGPILKDLGINLVVHNIAQGANNCAPYILCYETMGGADPDFVGWEQSYNCGHDDGIFESAARIAGGSTNRGGVVYYSASGAWSPKSCPPSADKPPFSSEEWTPSSAGLSEWTPSESDVETEKALLFKFNQDKATAARFSGAFANDYKDSMGFLGFNVWEKNKHCSFRNPKNNKTEACTGIDAAGGCAMRFMSFEASVYGSDTGKGADWHPTRAFHMLRGEAIAWLYGLVLFETVHMVEKALLTTSADKLRTEYAKHLSDLPALPHAKKCQGYMCEKRPQCHTDFKPHYSRNLTLTELVVGHTNWTYDAAEYGEWSLHYGYLDAKPQFSGSGSQGELSLRIHVGDTDKVWLCGATKESFMHTAVYVDLNVPDFLLVGYIPSNNRVVWHKKKYLGFECKALLDLPKGTHVISLLTNSTVAKHVTSLTHIIMW